MSVPDILQRRATHFLLWRPAVTDPVPRLVIGRLQPGSPPVLAEARTLDLRQSAEHADVWEVAAADCGLDEGVYHYWFEVIDSSPS